MENRLFANGVSSCSISKHLWFVLRPQRSFKTNGSLRTSLEIWGSVSKYCQITCNIVTLVKSLLKSRMHVWLPHWDFCILNWHFTKVLGMSVPKSFGFLNMSSASVEHFCFVGAFDHDLNESQKVSYCKFTQISAFSKKHLITISYIHKEVPETNSARHNHSMVQGNFLSDRGP